jgi:hypothetical protein
MIVAIGSTHTALDWWAIPMLVVTYLFTATTPVFCFALYRDEVACASRSVSGC